MLVSKGYAKDSVVCFKLVNGDEIIAKVIDQQDEGFLVDRPCTVIPGPKGIGLMQSLISGDINKNITISSQHIMMHSEVVPEIESHYIQTTTGIEQIPKGRIIT
jgi:hypothetical protein